MITCVVYVYVLHVPMAKLDKKVWRDQIKWKTYVFCLYKIN